MKFKKLHAIFLLLAVNIYTPAMVCAANFDLLTTDIAKWMSDDIRFGYNTSKAIAYCDNNQLYFDNTSGLWPTITYKYSSKIQFNIYKNKILYDFTPGKCTNIKLFFNGKNKSESVVINSRIKGALIDNETGQISKSDNNYSGELSLKGLNSERLGHPIDSYADIKGNIYLTGVSISVIGGNKGTIIFRNLSVLNYLTDATKKTTDAETTLAETKSGIESTLNSTVKTNNRDKSRSVSSANDSVHNAEHLITKGLNYYSSSKGSSKLNNKNGNDYNNTKHETDVGDTDIKTDKMLEENVTAAVKAAPTGLLSNESTTWLMISLGIIILLVVYLVFFNKHPKNK